MIPRNSEAVDSKKQTKRENKEPEHHDDEDEDGDG